MDQLNYIALNDIFWIRFQHHHFNFGFKGLPPDVHFTIAFNPNSQFVNLHLTRNVKGVKINHKPYIQIASIAKQDLEKLENDVPVIMLRTMLEPFDMVAFRAKHGSEIGFLSHEDIRKDGLYPAIQQNLEKSFTKFSKPKKKTGIKIEGPVFETLEGFSTNQEMMELVSNNIRDIPDSFDSPVSGGMLITASGTTHLIRIGQTWYKMREDIRIRNLLEGFVGPELAQRLIRHVKRSIVKIAKANNSTDTFADNRGIHLSYMPKNKN